MVQESNTTLFVAFYHLNKKKQTFLKIMLWHEQGAGNFQLRNAGPSSLDIQYNRLTARLSPFFQEYERLKVENSTLRQTLDESAIEHENYLNLQNVHSNLVQEHERNKVFQWIVLSLAYNNDLQPWLPTLTSNPDLQNWPPTLTSNPSLQNWPPTLTSNPDPQPWPPKLTSNPDFQPWAPNKPTSNPVILSWPLEPNENPGLAL